LSYFGDRSQILTRHAKFGKQHIFLLLLNYSVTSPSRRRPIQYGTGRRRLKSICIARWPMV